MSSSQFYSLKIGIFLKEKKKSENFSSKEKLENFSFFIAICFLLNLSDFLLWANYGDHVIQGNYGHVTKNHRIQKLTMKLNMYMPTYRHYAQ